MAGNRELISGCPPGTMEEACRCSYPESDSDYQKCNTLGLCICFFTFLSLFPLSFPDCFFPFLFLPVCFATANSKTEVAKKKKISTL